MEEQEQEQEKGKRICAHLSQLYRLLSEVESADVTIGETFQTFLTDASFYKAKLVEELVNYPLGNNILSSLHLVANHMRFIHTQRSLHYRINQRLPENDPSIQLEDKRGQIDAIMGSVHPQE